MGKARVQLPCSTKTIRKVEHFLLTPYHQKRIAEPYPFDQPNDLLSYTRSVSFYRTREVSAEYAARLSGTADAP